MKRALLAAAVIVLLAGCAPTAGEPTPEPAPSTPAADYSALPDEFAGTGSFVAGEDIQPGTYLVVAEHPSCEWHLGVDGTLIASGANDVFVEPGQTVEVSGCAVFELAE